MKRTVPNFTHLLIHVFTNTWYRKEGGMLGSLSLTLHILTSESCKVELPRSLPVLEITSHQPHMFAPVFSGKTDKDVS